LARKKKDMEFLTTLITNVPDGTSDATVDETRSREAIRAAQLAEQGYLLRLWRPPVEPGEWRTLGLWRAESESELRSILATLPLHIWMTVEVTPLNPHPNDPAGKRA
jgi:muconolactone D-isomerase